MLVLSLQFVPRTALILALHHSLVTAACQDTGDKIVTLLVHKTVKLLADVITDTVTRALTVTGEIGVTSRVPRIVTERVIRRLENARNVSPVTGTSRA